MATDTSRSAFRRFRSGCTLGIISLFVIFLAASAPHRVHHFFENLPLHNHSHSHNDHAGDNDHSRSPGNDHESPQPQQSNCAVQSVAQNSHVSAVQLIEIPFSEIALAHKPNLRIIASSFFDASPFSQRAPPVA
jgi:hypothetical protein